MRGDPPTDAENVADGLLGRAEECRRLDALVAAATEGRGGSLVVRGEPGIGKTTLLRYAGAKARGALVLRAEGVPFEADLAFSALHEMLRPLLGRLDDLPEPQADALRVAFAVSGTGQVTGGYAVPIPEQQGKAEPGPEADPRRTRGQRGAGARYCWTDRFG